MNLFLLLFLFLLHPFNVISFTSINKNIIHNAYQRIKKDINTKKEEELIEKFKNELIEISERQRQFDNMVHSLNNLKERQNTNKEIKNRDL
jgi:hypothetical protein